MPAKDLGTKFTCFKCQTKFYDMKKPAPVCPKCGADQREAVVQKPASTRKPREKAPVVPVEPAEDEAGAEEEADLEEAGGEDDEEIEDEDEDV